MEYTIQKLAKIAKISTRTLRYYDEIDLLKPHRINKSGYRIYEQTEINRLQQILFYRHLGFPLSEIKEIVSNPDFNEEKALQNHYQALMNQKEQLDQLIQNVYLTLKSYQGGIEMSNSQKFEGFKRELVEENEARFGKEVRDKYGEKQMEGSYYKLKNLTLEQYNEWESLRNQILVQLGKAMETKNPSSELAQELAQMHQHWLSYSWKIDKYS